MVYTHSDPKGDSTNLTMQRILKLTYQEAASDTGQSLICMTVLLVDSPTISRERLHWQKLVGT